MPWKVPPLNCAKLMNSNISNALPLSSTKNPLKLSWTDFSQNITRQSCCRFDGLSNGDRRVTLFNACHARFSSLLFCAHAFPFSHHAHFRPRHTYVLDPNIIGARAYTANGQIPIPETVHGPDNEGRREVRHLKCVKALLTIATVVSAGRIRLW